MSYTNSYDRTDSRPSYEEPYGFPYYLRLAFRYGVPFVLGALIALAFTSAYAAEFPGAFELDSLTPATFTPDFEPTDPGPETSFEPAGFEPTGTPVTFNPTEFSAAGLTAFNTPATFTPDFEPTVLGPETSFEPAGFEPTGTPVTFTPTDFPTGFITPVSTPAS